MSQAQVVRASVGALVRALPALAVHGSGEGTASSVVYNSMAVTPGACFVAIRGRRADGHCYIGEALARGAVVVVGEDAMPADFPADRTYVRVADSRRELGTLAAQLYGNPSRRMEVIGITGTDGKTTTTNLIATILRAGGRRTGLMSTVDFSIGDEHWQNTSRFTTLEAPEVQGLLARMADAGVESALVETTSSGLALHRVWGVAYDSAVVTNITSEHLEVHGTKEAYWRAKAMLLERIDPQGSKAVPFAVPHACVLNADDSSFAFLRGYCAAPLVTYGIDAPADVRAENMVLADDGARFRVRFPDGDACAVQTSLMARYNVSNCLAALALGYVHGVAPAVMARALAAFPGVPGRMERIDAGQPFTVFVDYAHTADSLEKVLTSLRPLTAGRLIAVFGSAGERDRVKRPLMGAVAARLADFAVFTDEDPREEDAEAILCEIAAGARASGAREHERYECVLDRRAGIRTALGAACPGDTVLLAGKGHEQSLIVGREKRPWDDRAVARAVLAELGYGATHQG